MGSVEDRAIAEAFREVTGPNGALIPNYHVVDFIMRRSREIAAALREQPEDSRLLGELLAVIHRDGGHYQAQHGTAKAVADAMAKFHEQPEARGVVPAGWAVEVDGEHVKVTKPDGAVSEWYMRPATNGSGMYDLCLALAAAQQPAQCECPIPLDDPPNMHAPGCIVRAAPPSAPVGVEGLEALQAKWCESTAGRPVSRRIATFDVVRNSRGEDDFDNEVWATRRCATDLGKFIEQQRALTQQPAQAAPGDGWKLVPVEPTDDMLNAYQEEQCRWSNITHVDDDATQSLWAAMLAAAPTPPGDDAARGA